MKQCCLCGKSGHESRDCTWNGKFTVSIAEKIFIDELRFQRQERSSLVDVVVKCKSNQS